MPCTSKQSVWWPGISREIVDLIQNCRTCAKTSRNPVEPLIPTPTPEYPWQKVASDMFEWQKNTYLLVVDYFSRFIEVVKMKKTTSQDVINEMKKMFARHGIPQIIISDNGPQYSAEEFKHFSQSWGFSHIASSPLHPYGNGLAERTVRTL